VSGEEEVEGDEEGDDELRMAMTSVSLFGTSLRNNGRDDCAHV
jgi:hypothetical protein